MYYYEFNSIINVYSVIDPIFTFPPVVSKVDFTIGYFKPRSSQVTCIFFFGGFVKFS